MFFQKIVDTYFPNLTDGTVLEIIVHNRAPISLPTLREKWKGLYVSKKPLAINLHSVKQLNGVVPSLKHILRLWSKHFCENFIHVCIFQHTDFLTGIEKILLTKIRFGCVIIWYDKVKIGKKRSLFRHVFVSHKYKIVITDNPKMDVFVSSVGTPPFYQGQIVFQKYQIKDVFKAGCGSTGVYLLKDRTTKLLYVLKMVTSHQEYQNEKQILKLLQHWPYSPKLVQYDDTHNWLMTTYCGKEMRTAKNSKKKWAKPRIQAIAKELQQLFGIYHNDIRWKNIVKEGRHLTLIDWGMSSHNNTDKNPQHIL
jgi:predicted Ser/Thr protein kinase